MSKHFIKLNVNNNYYEIGIDDRESLYDTLRNRLNLTSIKKGCEVGECGVCSVLVNGICIDSCIYLTIWAKNKKIITVEGLSKNSENLTDIQNEFIKQAAVQCGFCTPGFILKAVEIVGHNKPYSREEIKKLISGNLCRCTGYVNIINAIQHSIQNNLNRLNIDNNI